MSHDKKCVDVNVTAHVGDCESVPTSPATTPAGETIIRVPVTLAELNVRTNLVANIKFPDPVLEIKHIKKRVKIIQCRLLLPGIPESSPNPFAPTDLRLFIKGFVRKNIQYATPCPNSSGSCVSSEMKSLTADVPFECVTTIGMGQFLNPPQLPFNNTSAEFDFYREQDLGHGYPEKDH